MTAPAQRESAPAPDQWTIGEALAWTQRFFADKNIASPRLDAELLLAHALDMRRLDIYLRFDQPLAPDERAAYRTVIKRRMDGEPVAYIRGAKEFWSRDFLVTPEVLIPRPETEMLVEFALERIPGAGEEVQALDLCTGSGAVAVTLAAEKSQLLVTATDTSPAALDIARRNADRYGTPDRVTFLAGDLYAPVADRTWDIILANPPYIPTDALDTLAPDVQAEPRAALDGGADGLALIRRIIAGAGGRLKPGGWCGIEIGADQGPAVCALCAEAGLSNPTLHNDYAGRPRIVTATA